MSASGTGAWKNELLLISELAALNQQLTAYVIRALDADAQREEPTAPTEEQRLGSRLVELGNELQARAAQRSTNTRSCTAGEHPARSIAARQRPRETPAPWTNPDSPIYEP